MANTAINHDPAATFPGSSTDTAVVKWSGTGGKTLANSGVTIDASNNVTVPGNVTTTGYVHLTGDEKALRFYEGANYIAIAAPSGLGADYTFTLPLNDGATDEYLQTNGSGVLTWAAAGGTAVAGTTDNGILTFVNSGSTFAAEANLTWNGTTLITKGGAAATSGVQIEAYTTANYPARLVLQKSNNATVGSHTALEADEILGAIDFLASDGNSFELGARIRADSIDDVWSGSNRGTKIRIYTVPNGSTSEALAMTIHGNKTVEIEDNLIIGTAGKGIDFSAATPDESGAGSMGSEILDDYEEGTWTPLIQDHLLSDRSQAYSIQFGRYQKVGNRVHISGRVELNGLGSLTTSSGTRIAGFPFTSSSTTNNDYGVVVTYTEGLAMTANASVTGKIYTNTTYAYMFEWDSTLGVGGDGLTLAELSTDGHLEFFGSYEV